MSDVLLANFLSPIVFAFVPGIGARLAGVDLRLPKDIHAALSIYLLFALGLKGGHESSHATLGAIAAPAGAALLLGLVTPVSACLL